MSLASALKSSKCNSWNSLFREIFRNLYFCWRCCVKKKKNTIFQKNPFYWNFEKNVTLRQLLRSIKLARKFEIEQRGSYWVLSAHCKRSFLILAWSLAFSVHYLVSLPSFLFQLIQSLLIRIITFPNWYKKNALVLYKLVRKYMDS